ncbi:hypothetical protein [Pseudoneobacillus rhizosphaerae]|uniref:Uncharacterized protein n=1 Tax=Pseudoneobacillus rhizosphaerae TaxID=2880968 RepID=A0A9C7GA45_9BACI|nr:hypothetical protein [Pseudoneobacillus rhizosphaerae]CAG9608362.1 hypothetical protein NEOCIP111885_02054 [Pseudoneobacillus rhizosphaerae]
MIITECKGYELEKEKPNTSEDYFNRSEITYIEDGVEKNLHVLYVRYYEEQLNKYTPFEVNPVFQFEGNEIYLRDLVALVCLMKNPGLRHRKRLYINTEKEFQHYFQDINFEKIKELLSDLLNKPRVEIKSPLQFINQPN